MHRRSLCRNLVCLPLVVSGCGGGQPSPTTAVLTVKEARTLAPRILASRLIGPALGSRVIEAVRREYPARGGIPREVDLYSQPEFAWPQINGICRTDVVTVEYDWFDHDNASETTPLNVVHVEAVSRYKAFPMPPGEPGSSINEEAQSEQCAKMTTAKDAFRAPSAGDAQWLAKLAQEYMRGPVGRAFPFTCDDFQDLSCKQSGMALSGLSLGRATRVVAVDCHNRRPNDQINYCYQLTFPYPDSDNVEWQIAVEGGMRNGMAPVEIRSLHLHHQRKPMVMH